MIDLEEPEEMPGEPPKEPEAGEVETEISALDGAEPLEKTTSPAYDMAGEEEEATTKSRSVSPQKMPLQATDPNRGTVVTPEADAQSSEKTPAKAQKPKDEPAKSLSTLSSGPKPLYRVGLSKRSRIAPLLKIIRKDSAPSEEPKASKAKKSSAAPARKAKTS
jgi:hypothetical protein